MRLSSRDICLNLKKNLENEIFALPEETWDENQNPDPGEGDSILLDLQQKKEEAMTVLDSSSSLKTIEEVTNDIKVKSEKTLQMVEEIVVTTEKKINERAEIFNKKISEKETIIEKKKDLIQKILSEIEELDIPERGEYSNNVFSQCSRTKTIVGALEDARKLRIERSSDANNHDGPICDSFVLGEKIKILLSGEFSSGKTTLIKRLIGEFAGIRTSFPQTACLIKHSLSDTPFFKVIFKKDFSIDNHVLDDKFTAFLKEVKIADKFVSSKNQWKFLADEHLLESPSIDKCMEYLKAADDFPSAFQEIQWAHRKINRKNSPPQLWDFIELYDMPGIGGGTSHREVIENILSAVTPDILFFVISTERGMPTEEGLQELEKWLDIFNNQTNSPAIYWVYQKPSTELNLLSPSEKTTGNTWLKEKSTLLQSLYDNTKEKSSEQNQTGTILANALHDIHLLDARGSIDDKENAGNALAYSVARFYKQRLDRYIDSSENDLKEINTLPLIMYGNDQNKISPMLPVHFFKDIFEEIIESKAINYAEAREIFLEKFGLSHDSSITLDLPQEAHTYISNLYKNAVDVIDDILRAACRKEKTILSGFFKGNQDNKINIDYIFGDDPEFLTDYNKNEEWKNLFFKAQSLKMVVSLYSGDMPGFFLRNIEQQLINQLKKDADSFVNLVQNGEEEGWGMRPTSELENL